MVSSALFSKGHAPSTTNTPTSSARARSHDSVKSPPIALGGAATDGENSRILHCLRLAHVEVEKAVAAEITKSLGSAAAHKAELTEERAKVEKLSLELEKLSVAKNAVADNLEESRKECARLTTENQLANEELIRLRRAVEELTAERTAASVGRKAIDVELAAVETASDVLGRALGAATKQLYKQKQQQLANEGGSPAPKPRPSSVGAKKGAKSVSTGGGITPTGGGTRQVRNLSSVQGRGLPW